MQTTLLYVLGYASICIVALALLELAHVRERRLAHRQHEERLSKWITQVAILQNENDQLRDSMSILRGEQIDPHDLSVYSEALEDG